jgi:hypothetical protein
LCFAEQGGQTFRSRGLYSRHDRLGFVGATVEAPVFGDRHVSLGAAAAGASFAAALPSPAFIVVAAASAITPAITNASTPATTISA